MTQEEINAAKRKNLLRNVLIGAGVIAGAVVAGIVIGSVVPKKEVAALAVDVPALPTTVEVA
jgi:hypothetical protein